MRARSIVIFAAAAMLLAAPAAAADQGSPGRAPEAAQPNVQPAPTVLASAGAVVLPAVLKDQSATPAPRPRAARVTSCRCGGDPAVTDVAEVAETAEDAPQR
jgi:hypothetical protein